MAADPILVHAIEVHRSGRLAEAKVLYKRLLRRRPNDTDALNFMGMLECQSGDVASGAKFLHRAVKAGPSNPHAWLNLGNALLAQQDASGAKAAFTRATELAPEMPIAWFNLGVCLRRFKAPEQAAACFHKALQLEPGYAPAYEALGVVLYRLGDLAQAAEVYREWLHYQPGDPVASHMLAAMTGVNAPARADDAFVVATFDKFADHFDENLRELGYRAPQLLAARLGELVGSAADLDILDAGCGTGLCAPLLRSMARRLTGVDLSPGMIAKAQARGGYDELVIGELTAFMLERRRAYDVVLSADTLCYFGALEPTLGAAHGCLRDGGVLAFTLERLVHDDRSYRIEPHGRYSHAEVYVRQALVSAGFTAVDIEHAVLRRERGADVAGLVISARAAD